MPWTRLTHSHRLHLVRRGSVMAQRSSKRRKMDAEGRHDAIEDSPSEELVASQGISELADMALERSTKPLKMTSCCYRACLATLCFFEVSSHASPVTRIAHIASQSLPCPLLALVTISHSVLAVLVAMKRCFYSMWCLYFLFLSPSLFFHRLPSAYSLC